MYRFTVNGRPAATEKEVKLLGFLREDLRLASVKDGCSEGACGACMVLVDGKAVKACTLTTAKADGKTILTVEGLSEREKAVYGYAFPKAGAVQCGFCIPGMIISAKALLDRIPEPDSDQLAQAIKGNLCRCTGYKKIKEAVLLAARMLREGTPVPREDISGGMGEPLPRIDARDKTLGLAHYADDLAFPGMLYGGAVRSAYPRARICSVDVSAAKAAQGVYAVITAADLPGSLRVGHLKKDQYVLVPVGGITTYLGDPIALLAADTKEHLAAAKKLVRVTYEELPGVFSAQASAAPDALQVHEGIPNLLAHEHLVRGDAQGKISRSKYVVTRTYTTPPTEHAFLEPETAVAVPEGDGIHIYSGDQGIYQTRRECAEATGLPLEKVRVTAMMVGGGFGGKEDMSVQHHAALLALAAGRAVKVSLSRKESMLVHPKRHGMRMQFTTACDGNGRLTAMKAEIIADTGAFASLGGPVLQRACTHAAGPYNYQDIEIEGWAYYTNNPPCGAFRGFGVTQSCFAMESNLNLLAERVGISPWEIRYRNAIRPGQTLPNGQIADASTALVEALEAVKPYYDAHPEAGIACAMKNSGLGVGIPDVGRCRIQVRGGILHLYSSAACIGQGLGTVLAQVACETTGLPLEHIRYEPPDTALAPDAGNTTASRQTLFTGEACRRACRALLEAWGDSPLEALEGREFLGEYSGVTDKLGCGKPNPVSHIAYGYAVHVADLDEEGKLRRIIAAHDVGRAVNPVSLEGQIEGGVTMGLGYTLTEAYPLDHGRPTAKFGTLGLLRSVQVPEIRPLIVEKGGSGLAYDAKGIGEISAIPTAPAVALAYYNRDRKFRTSLPLEGTPYSRK